MNNSNSILLIDPSFDPSTASGCNLLVKIGIDSFSYAIINRQNNKVIAVYDEPECEDVNLKLAERIQSDPYFTLLYNEVKIAISTSNAISVPNILYDEYSVKSHAKLFPSFNGGFYTQRQQHFDFTTIFSISKSSDLILNKHFPLAKKLYENTGLIRIAEKITEDSLILDFSVGSFHAVYIKNQQVIFQQCYQVEQAEEFNYYLLFIINQLVIDTKNTTLLLSGIIHKDDEKYNCVCKYFNNVQFLNASDDLDQEILDDMPLHYYSNLLTLDQCVL